MIIRKQSSSSSRLRSKFLFSNRNFDESGQTLIVELVLLFPIMLALTFGVLEFGWWVNAHMVTANAASQAARDIAINGKISPGTVPNQIEAVAKGGGLNTNNVRWTVNVPGENISETGTLTSPITTNCIYQSPSGYQQMETSVTVTYTYQPLFLFLRTPMFLDIGKVLPNNITATATVPVNQEWPAGGGC